MMFFYFFKPFKNCFVQTCKMLKLLCQTTWLITVETSLMVEGQQHFAVSMLCEKKPRLNATMS